MLEEQKNSDEVKDFIISNLLLMNGSLNKNEVNDRLRFFRKEYSDKINVFVGMGNCGVVAGALKTKVAIQNYFDERKINATIIEVGCIGLCSFEPIVDIQLPGKTRISFKQVKADKVSIILDGLLNNVISEDYVIGQYQSNELVNWYNVNYIQDIPFFAKQKRIVLENSGIIDPYSIEEYIARGGFKTFIDTVKHHTFEEVLEIIEKSELRGRGGAGFLTGEKWKVAYQTPHEQRYLICNAEESDPGVFKDRTIIEGDPHKVIEGIALASYAIGCTRSFIFIRNDYKLAINRLEKAISNAKEYGLLGQNIFNSGYNLEIIIIKGAGAFVCGEETALISHIEGKRAMPKPKPPYPAEYGLFGKPTVINNVETLSTIPSILSKGAEWFKSIGTEHSRGTKIFALSGKVKNTCIIEIPMGTMLKDVILSMGGGVRNNQNLKAVHIGGPSGICIKENNIDIPLDFNSFKELGVVLGLGGIVVLDDKTCMVELAKYFINYMQKQSCGKCIPCREGTKRLLEILDNITKKPIDTNGHTTLERFKGVLQLESISSVMKDTSLCGLGQKAANPLMSFMTHFREEFEEHIFDRKCRATICRDLKEYVIDNDKCTGCGACAKKCPENAIVGTLKQVHYIVKEKCSNCGVCYETCKFSAIIIK